MNDELSNILLRVRTLYRKYGIRSVTMDDVSRELGISKKTLYQYVLDKDELVRKVIDLEVETRLQDMQKSCREDLNAVEELLEIAQCISYMLKEYSPVIEYDLNKYYPDVYLRLREMKREHMFKFIHDNLIKGKKEGLYRIELDIDILTKLSVSHIDGMFDSEVIAIDEFLDRRFYHEYFIYHLHGIANEKGLQVLKEQLRNFENIEE